MASAGLTKFGEKEEDPSSMFFLPTNSSLSQSSLQSLAHIFFCSRRMVQTCLNYPGLKAEVLLSVFSSHCTPVPIPRLLESLLKFINANK